MSETAWILITFVVSQGLLLTFLFTVGRRFSERFWKATDFLWFTGALLGAIGAMERWQEQQTKAMLEKQGDRVNQLAVSVSTHASHLHLYRLHNPLNAEFQSLSIAIDDLATPNPPTDAAERRAIRNELEALRGAVFDTTAIHEAHQMHSLSCDVLNDAANKRIAHNADKYLKKYRHSPDTPEGHELNESLRDLVQEAVNYQEMEAVAERPWWSRELNHYFPFLLAIAISIRLTRVAAEVFVLGRGVSWFRKSAQAKPGDPTTKAPEVTNSVRIR